MSHTSKNIVKNISIDCVVFGFEDSQMKVLLIKRKRSPEKGRWALPGGFVLNYETLDQAAVRILEATSNVKDIYLEQVHAFSQIDRFPGKRVITVAYFALINPERHSLKPGIDTTDVKWFKLKDKPNMPFDHNKIFNFALNQLRNSAGSKPIGFQLLPEKFSLTQLQNLYEGTLDEKLDKRNFRKKILSMDLLKISDEKESGVAHRAAKLYKFDLTNYKKIKNNGFNFKLY